MDLADVVKNKPVEETKGVKEASSNLEEKERKETILSEVIPVTTLISWFNTYDKKVRGVKRPKVQINTIDQNEQLILTYPVSENKRKLVVIDDADKIIVLNLPPLGFKVHTNGFMIVYDKIVSDIYIKSYYMKNIFVCTFCFREGNLLVPFHIVKGKKNRRNLTIDEEEIKKKELCMAKLRDNLDMESLVLLYKPAKRAQDLKTNLDAVKWLVEKQQKTREIYHLIQIDDVIINLLTT